eukprot:gene51289-62721_t
MGDEQRLELGEGLVIVRTEADGHAGHAGIHGQLQVMRRVADHQRALGLGAELAHQLQQHQKKIFPPQMQKTLRLFSPAEAAAFIGIGEGYLRQIASEGHGPEPLSNGRRMYAVSDIERIRRVLDEGGKSGKYVPHRRGDERLQVISVMNFKGGSAKTTTSAHLAQYLALRGYRTLAIDLDPQASLSALFGH